MKTELNRRACSSGQCTWNTEKEVKYIQGNMKFGQVGRSQSCLIGFFKESDIYPKNSRLYFTEEFKPGG